MSIETRFADIGARVKVRERPQQRRRRNVWNPDWLPSTAAQRMAAAARIAIDIRNDRKGEYFDVTVPHDVEMEVIDADPASRHLVLMARLNDAGDKARYLCGHDERHWFVAAVPENYPTTTVEEAKRALQPASIRDLTTGLSGTKRIARHNEAYRRQGEWFFVPAPDLVVGPNEIILRNEPLRRDQRSKPHIASEAVRTGGETRFQAIRASVHAVRDSARAKEIRLALDNKTLPRLEKERMEALYPEVSWQSVLVNPTMYVRGPIRHSDHATLNLKGWHRVVMNAESMARASSHIMFID